MFKDGKIASVSAYELAQLQCILFYKKQWSYSEVIKWIDFFFNSTDKTLALSIIEAMPKIGD